jgi:hypothetical protein
MSGDKLVIFTEGLVKKGGQNPPHGNYRPPPPPSFKPGQRTTVTATSQAKATVHHTWL